VKLARLTLSDNSNHGRRIRTKNACVDRTYLIRDIPVKRNSYTEFHRICTRAEGSAIKFILTESRLRGRIADSSCLKNTGRAGL
jgi:hypothetical protein